MVDVKVDKVEGCNVYITINCPEDSNGTHREKDPQRISVRRVLKPSSNDFKDPTVLIDGMKWPSFAEYVTKNLLNGDKKPCDDRKQMLCN